MGSGILTFGQARATHPPAFRADHQRLRKALPQTLKLGLVGCRAFPADIAGPVFDVTVRQVERSDAARDGYDSEAKWILIICSCIFEQKPSPKACRLRV